MAQTSYAQVPINLYQILMDAADKTDQFVNIIKIYRLHVSRGPSLMLKSGMKKKFRDMRHSTIMLGWLLYYSAKQFIMQLLHDILKVSSQL